MTACLLMALPFCTALTLFSCADGGPDPVDAGQARAFIEAAEARH